MHDKRWHHYFFVILFCFIAVPSCTYDRDEKMVQQWTYEYNDSVSHFAMSSDGRYIVFVSSIDNLLKEKNPKCSLVCLSSDGKKRWEYKGLEYKGVKKVLASEEYILVYMGDHEFIDTSGSGKLFLFTIFGKLLWSKDVWGKPYFVASENAVLVSKYTKRYFQAWGDEGKLPEGCVDPDVQVLGGGDSIAYDVRDASVLLDISSGRVKKVINIIGIEKPSGNANYFLSSCIGRTALYDNHNKSLFIVGESGIVDISPDEQFVVMHYQAGKKSNKVASYDRTGHLLWSKKVEGSLNNPDGGLMPLNNGFTAVLAANWSSDTGEVIKEDSTLTFLDRKGDDVWSNQKISGFPIKLIAASEDGKYVLVGAEKKEKNEYDSSLFLLNYKGDIISRSKKVNLGNYNPLKYIAIDKEAKHAVLVDAKRIFFFDTSIKNN